MVGGEVRCGVIGYRRVDGGARRERWRIGRLLGKKVRPGGEANKYREEEGWNSRAVSEVGKRCVREWGK